MDPLSNFHRFCFTKYWEFRETNFTRYSGYRDLVEIIRNSSFEFKKRGKSFEGRDIYSFSFGHGKTRVLLWTQMHGDESTATGAILDILKMLSNPKDPYKDILQEINSNLSLCFVPMLNPDGAERWQRRNSIGIDLNRDARLLASPESKILDSLFNSFKPDYCFNLHDQSGVYTAGLAEIPATISLLAPPYDKSRGTEKKRLKAIAGVNQLYKLLSNYIPNAIGKWEDEYEPRAFGEHFQSKGAATILIESGAFPNDPERNMARRLNFTALLYAFASLARNQFDTFKPKVYENIPENKKRLYDLLLLNTALTINKKIIYCDLALMRKEKKLKGRIAKYWTLEQLGDLNDTQSYIGAKTLYHIKARVDENNILHFKDQDLEITLPFNIE